MLNGVRRIMNNKSFSFEERSDIIKRPTYVPAWPSEQFIVPLLQKHIVDALNEYAVHPRQRARVLDIGCGRQPFRQDMERLGYIYMGLDVEQNPEGTVGVLAEIDCNFLNDYPDLGQFDLIICTEVLEHVAQWHVAFRNIYELTAPGGKILITCPHFYQLHEEPYDFWRPTNHALEYYAKKEGFRILKQIKAGDAWDVLGTVLANMYSFNRINSSFSSKIIRRIADYVRTRLFKVLSKGMLQKYIGVNSPLYLANIIVLQRD